MKKVLPLLVVVAVLLVATYAYLNAGHEEKEGEVFQLLDENLNPIKTSETLPKEVGNRVLIGKTAEGYVYVPKEETFRPRFVDRFLFYQGKLEDAKLFHRWWMEYRGKRIEPVENTAYRGYEIVVETPFEVVRSTSQVIALYQPVYIGRYVETNDSCIAIKEWEGLLVPVVLSEESGIVDPDYTIKCRKCNAWVVLTVVDERGKPLEGFFSEGSGTIYNYFGRFRGKFKVCRCSRVKVYVSGYIPKSLTACEDEVIKLEKLKGHKKNLEGNYIFMDSTGALVSMGGKAVVPEGSYRAFNRFPLKEVNRSLPVVKLDDPVWVGTQQREIVPVYSLVRKGYGYFYVLKNRVIEAEGFICKGSTCSSRGNVPLIAFGTCEAYWNGGFHSNCPGFGIKLISEGNKNS